MRRREKQDPTQKIVTKIMRIQEEIIREQDGLIRDLEELRGILASQLSEKKREEENEK